MARFVDFPVPVGPARSASRGRAAVLPPDPEAWIRRDELLELCADYVRRRTEARPGAVGSAAGLPLVAIVEGYLHGEISESEKNSLISFVRGVDADDDGDDRLISELAEATLAELDDPVG